MATIAAAVNASTDVLRFSGLASPRRGMLLAVDDEIVELVEIARGPGSLALVAPGAWRVLRGRRSTVAASHAEGATVTVVVPQFATVPLEQPGAGGASDAASVSYDNVESGLTAEDVQALGDELADTRLDETAHDALDHTGLTGVGGGGTTGSGAPTEPAEAVNEAQLLEPADPFPWTGTFKIGFEGQETSDIDVNVTTLDQIVALLEALSTVGAGNIIETSGTGTDTMVDNGGTLAFEFIGDLGGQDVAEMEVADLAVLSDGNPIAPEDFAFTTDAEGAAATLGTPPNPTAGQLYVDDQTGDLYWYDGAYWQSIIAGTHGAAPVVGATAHNLLRGTVDPTAGAGVGAMAGAMYQRDVSGDGTLGELWVKVGVTATAWEQVTTS